jgi:membrane peptidoglycan carboxypeptidase
LETYLNTIYLGNFNYGIKAAAAQYFGKTLGELQIGECAYLAGLVQAPSIFHPYANRSSGIQRSRLVLHEMWESGYITTAQLQEYMATDLRFAEDAVSIKAPHFTQYEYLKWQQSSENMSETLALHTQYNYQLHRQILAKLQADIQGEVAVIILDRQNRIVVMIGERDFFTDKQSLNFAIASIYTTNAEYCPHQLINICYTTLLEATSSTAPLKISPQAQVWGAGDYKAGVWTQRPVELELAEQIVSAVINSQ